MAAHGAITRRTLLVGGGAGAGLLLAWELWPRRQRPRLRAGPDEAVFNAFLKIANDGRVIVAVPQVELGQGVWTSLPQILADELGADWRTVAVEPAPPDPLYANALLADAAVAASLPSWLRAGGGWSVREHQTITAGSTSIRAFEPRMREAGAAARALLMKAAARRWGGPWDRLDTAGGFVTDGSRRIAFAELAEAAAKESLPDHLPVRGGVDNRLAGQPLPRLDLPSKVDGSAEYAGDVRLPDMVYASVRSGPVPDSRLARFDRKAALAVPAVLDVIDTPSWVAVLATNWWAANRGLDALATAWSTPGGLPTSQAIESALGDAESGAGQTVFSRGDAAAALAQGPVLEAAYSVGLAANAPLETLTATARFEAGRLEIWAPVQAPDLARAAAARAAGLPQGQVTLYPAMAGGGYGRKLEVKAVEQAAVLARRSKRPVQLVWSRIEESVQDCLRPPARARMRARLGANGAIAAWQARIAAPDLAPQLERRLGAAARVLRGEASPTAGAVPPYAIAAVAIDHLPARIGVEIGLWRSAAQSGTAFFTECFVDELAHKAGIAPLPFRMAMLGANKRLARCLSAAAALGGWDGGGHLPSGRGSAMGIACLSGYGSHIATLVEVEADGPGLRLLRTVSAVDCGRVVNPEIVRQQIEGGLLFGAAAALGAPIRFAGGRPSARGFGELGFPTLAATPQTNVELIESEEDPGGITELAVPTIAPAMANAWFALTGRRQRSLPLGPGLGPRL